MRILLTSSRFLFALLMITAFQSSAQINKPVILNHVAVYVFDLNTSTVFYKDVIGLTQIPEPFHDGKHTWFKIGEHSQLHLIQGAQAVTDHDKNSHLCFSVSSMDAFIAILKKNKIKFEDWPGNADMTTKRPDGVQQIYFTDPDGYWIEINNDTY